ncbi:MAG TPA: metallophosphoesterase family protein, partial [Acidimicrobiia bacterium]
MPTGPLLWARPGRTSDPPRAARIGWGADPRTTLTVSWSTGGPVANPAVEIAGGSFGGLVLAETRNVPGWDVHYHHAVIDGLEPSSAYRYRCRHDGAATATAMLRTAPAGAERFTFAAYGDQGTDVQARAVVGLLQAAAPAFTFCLGDLCYADPSGGVLPAVGVDHAAWDRWLRMLSRAVAANTALLPVVGNHEIETGMGDWGYDGLLARFALPTNGLTGLPTTWVARWGNVALLAADSNDVSTEITRNNGVSQGGQALWLEGALARLRADPDVDWIVVGFHHSAYCTNSLHGSDGGVRRWAPIFDRYQVDLVINGHNHCYERTHPLPAGAPVVELGSGQARWADG